MEITEKEAFMVFEIILNKISFTKDIKIPDPFIYGPGIKLSYVFLNN